MFSLTCFALAVVLAFIGPQPWIAVIGLYFLCKFLYRLYLLNTADPYLILSDDGLTVRWSRSKFIPWAEMTEITDTPEHTIAITYHPKGGEKKHVKHITKWRVEVSAEELMQTLGKCRDQAAGHSENRR